MMFSFANIWERIADVRGAQPAMIHGDQVTSWTAYEDRAARLATVYQGAGTGPKPKVAIFHHNHPAYLEAQFACFKISGCPINVNYRYVEDELIYLLDNADVEILVFEGIFADRVAAILARLPKLKLVIQRGGSLVAGAIDYETAIAGAKPLPRRAAEPDDLYMIYTGGTTGMPKGVMYRTAELSVAMFGGYDFRGIPRPATLDDIPSAMEAVSKSGMDCRGLVACPLMHGTGMWIGAFTPHNLGGCVITLTNPHFDPHELLATVERHKVTDITIVGDAFAKPILLALEAGKPSGGAYDFSSVFRMASSGVMWTAEVKQGLLKYAAMTLIDAMGSSEGGMASSVTTRDMAAPTAKFMLNPTSKVITDDGREVQPGSGEIGMVANGGLVPLGYYKDPEKSARTFKEVNGQRFAFPGDYAQVEADGSITLLGRGSQCINTAGEKVFPEEVEEAVKTHPAVYDCLVVGLPDEKFGQRVAAVLSLHPGQNLTPEELSEYLRKKLAAYKLPRTIRLAAEVRRAANGKADYGWAKEAVLAAS